MKVIGERFPQELEAAGLLELAIVWNENGIVSRTGLTPEQDAALDAVLAAHDPEATLD